jgi:hypothetical protein
MSFQAHPDTNEKGTGQPLRKVVAGYFLSLDGVAEAPDRFLTAWDDETDASGADLIATQDAAILGRRSYDEWAEFWPGSEIQPFASFINDVPKYVATSTPLEREWTNSRVIDGGLVDFVSHLKGQPGGRYRRPRQHFDHSVAACCRHPRRAQAHHRADDRRKRAKTVRRIAAHTARDDPRHCHTQWPPSRGLPRGSLGVLRSTEALTRGTSNATVTMCLKTPVSTVGSTRRSAVRSSNVAAWQQFL